MTRWFLAGLTFLLAGSTLIAQDQPAAAEAQFSAGNQSPLVGQPVTLTLSAVMPQNVTLVSWPDFPAQWSEFEIQEIGELEIVDLAGGALEYRQTLKVALWEPGAFQTPDVIIIYQQDGGEPVDLPAPPLDFEVFSVLDADDLSLRPLQEQIYLFYVPTGLVIGLMGGIVCAAIWLTDRRRSWRVVERSAGLEDLDRRILRTLAGIDLRVTESEEVFATTVDCLRDYITLRFRVAAHELTSSETLLDMQAHVSQPLLQRLHQLMTHGDLVKFADINPDQSAAERFVEATARWIQAAAREISQQENSGGQG